MSVATLIDETTGLISSAYLPVYAYSAPPLSAVLASGNNAAVQSMVNIAEVAADTIAANNVTGGEVIIDGGIAKPARLHNYSDNRLTLVGENQEVPTSELAVGTVILKGTGGLSEAILSTVGDELYVNGSPVAGSGLQSNTIYVNDGVNDIQEGIDSATAGTAVYVSAGSFGGSTVTINGKTNIAIIAPPRGQGTVCELAGGRGLTIGSTSTGSITIANLQIEGLLTLSGSGNYYFTNVQCLGGITVSAANAGNYFFSNCELAGLITVPNTFGGVVVFTQSNMSGATYSLSNASPLQVQFALCTNLPTSRPANATYGSANSDTSLQITTDTKYIRVNGGVGTAGQVLTSGGSGATAFWGTGGGGGVGTLAQVLAAGNDGAGLGMTNLGTVAASGVTVGGNAVYQKAFFPGVGTAGSDPEQRLAGSDYVIPTNSAALLTALNAAPGQVVFISAATTGQSLDLTGLPGGGSLIADRTVLYFVVSDTSEPLSFILKSGPVVLNVQPGESVRLLYQASYGGWRYVGM
jgi:hypothetical protein